MFLLGRQKCERCAARPRLRGSPSDVIDHLSDVPGRERSCCGWCGLQICDGRLATRDAVYRHLAVCPDARATRRRG
jgi:hypothetical protein